MTICSNCKYWRYNEETKQLYGIGVGICRKSGLPRYCSYRCKKGEEVKDIDFNKVRKPEFIKHHSFEPNLRIDGDLYTIERKISALAIEKENKIIVERIVEIAKENGITDLYLLDKKNIAEALKKTDTTEAVA